MIFSKSSTLWLIFPIYLSWFFCSIVVSEVFQWTIFLHWVPGSIRQMKQTVLSVIQRKFDWMFSQQLRDAFMFFFAESTWTIGDFDSVTVVRPTTPRTIWRRYKWLLRFLSDHPKPQKTQTTESLSESKNYSSQNQFFTKFLFLKPLCSIWWAN